ncbi:MAG TPA: hydantoinase B/oxoprolinase family protein [Ktedonobacterales bacterium]|nr:hydantoinase B/oxoprolinase family protein [Ktedonobacterales bacterium]
MRQNGRKNAAPQVEAPRETSSGKTDPIKTEIFRNRFQGIVDEMGQMLMRAAHTVFVKETQDFVVALVTPQGEVFAASRKVGIWIAIGMPFKTVLRAVPLAEGEIGITNSPDGSRGLVTHLPDVFLWKPVYDGAELICYAALFIHCTDIGGIVPGSVSVTASEQRQEGIEIPPRKFKTRGQVDETLLDIFTANSRIPEQNRGDISAMVGALDKAESRLHELLARYGRDEVVTGTQHVLIHAEQQARAVFAGIPDGTYQFVDYLEGDYLPDAQPIRIELALKVSGSDLELDFTGTDPQVQAALNLPTYSEDGHYMIVLGIVNFLRTINSTITYNTGMVRPVRVTVPEGTLLNPAPGAACGTRQATFFRVADVVQGALSRALPERMPAVGAGQGAILLVSIPDLVTGHEHISTVQPLVGGSGARTNRDGTDGVDFITGFYRNIPTEILECDMPLLVEYYRLRQDSAGAGHFRGGMGIEYAVRLLFPGAVVTARGLERFHFQPWGRSGGEPGECSSIGYTLPGEDEREIGKIDVLRPLPSSLVTFRTPGGGGWGDPYTRDPQAVLADVAEGLVSPEAARAHYGVAITTHADDGRVEERVDLAETERLRRARRDAASVTDNEYAFGQYRAEFEADLPDEVQRTLNRLVAGHTPIAKRFFRQLLVEAVRDHRQRSAPLDLDETFAAILQKYGLNHS